MLSFQPEVSVVWRVLLLGFSTVESGARAAAWSMVPKHPAKSRYVTKSPSGSRVDELFNAEKFIR